MKHIYGIQYKAIDGLIEIWKPMEKWSVSRVFSILFAKGGEVNCNNKHIKNNSFLFHVMAFQPNHSQSTPIITVQNEMSNGK